MEFLLQIKKLSSNIKNLTEFVVANCRFLSIEFNPDKNEITQCYLFKNMIVFLKENEKHFKIKVIDKNCQKFYRKVGIV